jgi:hypothetical protein
MYSSTKVNESCSADGLYIIRRAFFCFFFGQKKEKIKTRFAFYCPFFFIEKKKERKKSSSRADHSVRPTGHRLSTDEQCLFVFIFKLPYAILLSKFNYGPLLFNYLEPSV